MARPYARGLTKAVVGQAFRAPNIYELFFSDNLRSVRAINTLDPETILTFELEHSHDLTQELRVTVAGYYNLINRLIVSTADTDTKDCGSRTNPVYCDHYANVSDPVSAIGAEAQIRWQPGRFTLVEASYSYVYLRDPNAQPGIVDPPVPMPPNPPYPLTPVPPREPDQQLHLAAVRAMVPIYEGAVRLSAQLTYQSPRQRNAGSSLLLNLGIAGEYGALRYFAGVQNLLDTTVALPVSTEAGDTLVPQYGRSFLIQLSAGF